MQKYAIHFSHANGFPAATYRQFFMYLSTHFSVNYIDLLGHNPHYPVDDNWDCLTHEVIASIIERYDSPVIGVGHSLGGALTYMAALLRPDLFRAVILLDAPIYGPIQSTLLAFAKKFGLIDFVTPAGRTRYRRKAFPNAEKAFAYFKTRPLFSRFSPECLWDYVHEGMQKTEKGQELKFSPHIEYQIYRTLPHHLPWLKHKMHVPAALIYGKESNVVKSYDQKRMQKKGMLIASVEGGHLFPFEYPKASAETLISIVNHLVKVKISDTR